LESLWILMGFYSIRILRSFRGGVLSKGWRYISIAVPFLILGQLFTGMGESSTIALLEDQILRAAGASFSAIGGLMIIIGLRAEHNAWNPKGLKSSLSSAQDATPQRDRS
ncbi:MAG: hypothetical protein M1368_02730, partial [Thaumarchaeota archaeon]|nr:hypothetical protein [Nitrososphaerota archaeon]